MGKKVKLLPSLFKNKETTTTTTHYPWLLQQWPSCKQPKTLSFRNDDVFKTVNSVFLDPTDGDSWFTNSCDQSSSAASFSTESEESASGAGAGKESLEMVIRGVQSERLFFEPGDTSSILKEAKATGGGGGDGGDGGVCGFVPFKESVVVAMESEDPYVDFRRSMEEMVECHGLNDWECLEELLGWYLKVNGKKNHGIIVGAFVDLLVSLASFNISSDSTSFSSAVSCLSSPLCCSSDDQKEIHEEDEIVIRP